MAEAFMKWSDAWPPGRSYRLDHQTCTVITTNTIAGNGHQLRITLIIDDSSPAMCNQQRRAPTLMPTDVERRVSGDSVSTLPRKR